MPGVTARVGFFKPLRLPWQGMIVQQAIPGSTASVRSAAAVRPEVPQDLLEPAPPAEPPEVASFRRKSALTLVGATAAGAAVGLLVPSLISFAPAMVGGLTGVVVGTALALMAHHKKGLGMKATIALACAAAAAGSLAGVFLPMKLIGVALTAAPEWVRPLAGAALWGGSALAAVQVKSLASGLRAKVSLHQSELQAYHKDRQVAAETRQALPESDVREDGQQVQIGGVVLRKKKAEPEAPSTDT